jgi:hypothetical protein
MLLNGLIQPFQEPARVMGFFNYYREGMRMTRKTLPQIADQFLYWLKNRSENGVPIVDAPDQERRDEFVLPYMRDVEPGHVRYDPESARARTAADRDRRRQTTPARIWSTNNAGSISSPST